MRMVEWCSHPVQRNVSRPTVLSYHRTPSALPQPGRPCPVVGLVLAGQVLVVIGSSCGSGWRRCG